MISFGAEWLVLAGAVAVFGGYAWGYYDGFEYSKAKINGLLADYRAMRERGE